MATLANAELAAVPSAARIAVRSMEIMAAGDLADFEAVVHTDAVNREAASEPPASRGTGPNAFFATAVWLREVFADLRFEVHEVVAQGDLVVVHNTMYGRQVSAMVQYDADSRVDRAFPATGRTFASTQTHWFRIADGKVIEHWANRDDMATAVQLGWIPPTPRFLFRMALATRRARKNHAEMARSAA